MYQLKTILASSLLIAFFLAPLTQTLHQSDIHTHDISCNIYVLENLLLSADIDIVLPLILFFTLYLYFDLLTCKQTRGYYIFFNVRAPPYL